MNTQEARPENIEVAPIQSYQIAALAQLHLVAFAEYTNAKLGARYAEGLFQFFTARPERIALCASQDESELIGYAIGAPVGYNKEMTSVLWPTVAWAIATRPMLWFDVRFRTIFKQKLCSILQRRSAVPPASTTLPMPTMSLVGIAVHPLARGRHVGRRLLERFELEVLCRGYTAMQLSVYPENRAARQLYEQLQWMSSGQAIPGRAMVYHKTLIDVVSEGSK